MNQHRGGEARLEVALAQAIINEAKYGSETNQLAEVSLLAAFQNRAVGDKLAHALLLLMPSLQYFSIGALLKDGVIVRTSNLLIPGAVDVSAKSLRGTAARIAARKNSTLHVKRRAQDAKASKYLELQEVWEQVGATSVLSIPIPAVRSYESASILEAPAAVEEPASEPATHMSHVLHNSNGAIGVVTVGLATENIDLNGRQGKAFQAMAHSLSPFLAYYAAPALEELHGGICDVASANAASIAKFKARQQQAEQQSFQNDADADSSKQDSANAHAVSQGISVTSPFSAISHPEEISHPANQPQKAAPPPKIEESKACGSSSQPGHNPFAQAATISFSESTSEPPPANCLKSEQHKQPVSPFAAAADASACSFDTCLPSGQPEGNPCDQSAVQRRRGSVSSGSGHSETGGSVKSVHSAASNDACEEVATDAAQQKHQEHQEQDMTTLDTPFVFRRKPVSSAHVRRYSTSTFFQGVLHTPQGHLSHLSSLSTMVTVPDEPAQGERQQLPLIQEDSPQEQQQLPHLRQQTVFVDDYTYASVAQQMSRRALSTPSQLVNSTLDLTGVQAQMQAHGSCPGPLVVEAPTSGVTAPDATGTVAAAKTHLALQGQINNSRDQHNVTVRHAAEASASAPGNAVPTSNSPSGCIRQADATTSQLDESRVVPDVPHLGRSEFGEVSSPVKRAGAPPSTTSSAVHQHPLWLTFVDPRLEEGFGLWMGQRCSKVDTIFLLAATVYITQLLFYTWALTDQQAKKWPLLGYAMLPILLLQHGDTAWYLKNRSVIVTTVRCVLLVFLTCLVPAIVEGSDAPPSRFIDSSGLWPLVVISLGLLVRFKLHLAIHAISCASLVLQGLKKCTAGPHSSRLECQVLSAERLALVTCLPTVFLYTLEKSARVLYLQTTKH